MKLSKFKYDLPEELIALHPSPNRDESKLLVLNRVTGKIEHRIFKDIVEYFGNDDVLIFNDTKVFPARLYGNKEKTGAEIEVFLLRELNREQRLWDVLVDPARKIRIGNKLYFGEDDLLVAEVIDNTTSRGRTLRFLFDGPYDEFKKTLYGLGETPLPKFIKRSVQPEDKDRYQTIFAKNEGAVAAPTAGLHFSRELMKRMIKTVNLNKVFRTEEIETSALNDVNLHIQKGEFVAIMGPSGCGKSTLLNIIGLLDNPSSGEYYFDNQEVGAFKERNRTLLRKGNIGFVFQSFNLIDELNVYENVELPLIYLKMSARERKEMVEKVLERMKISHRKKHFPQQLSGGQQQRVAIARAVVANPKLILADEPTGNLDSKNGLEVMNLLTELNREGTTIVMVTHSMHDSEFAHRVINLFDGQVITEEVKNKMNEVLV